jgi:cadmium resistance protein CadD (predicted permease)
VSLASVLSTVLSAAAVFAGTNIDDLLVLTVLFLAARGSGRPRPAQIWAGQYLGIAALTAVAVVAATGLAVLPDRWVRLLGLVPLALGLVGLVRAARPGGGGRSPGTAPGTLAVAGITIANGGDNIAVYTPLFRTLGLLATALTALVFAVLVAVWCLAATWLGSHARVITVVERYGHWIVPAVFILIGLLILLA